MRISLTLILLLAGCGFGDNLAHRPTGHVCGDGVVDPGEACDDGNTSDGDGCSARCTVETANPVCGNTVVETGEQCDDGNTTDGDGCSADCQLEGETVCGLIPQAGCSGAEPACDIHDDGSTSCRAVTAQGHDDSTCSVETACDAGFTCVGDETGAVSSCAKFCASDTGCTGDGSRCVIGLVNTSGQPLDISVCSNACDVLGQTGCPSGLDCLVFASSGGAFTNCIVMGTKTSGKSCTDSTDCVPGDACITEGSQHICRELCDQNDDQCPGSLVCNGFTTSIVIGGVDFGACR